MSLAEAALKAATELRASTECASVGCSAPRLAYGHLCGPCDPTWVQAPPTRCQLPVRCYCPKLGCLGHPDAKTSNRVTPMPAPLVELRDELTARRRARVIERARGRAL